MAEAKPILMPKLGQTVEEASIVKWHKKEGDRVAQGDVLFEVETDKAVLESESFVDGTLLKIIVKEGQNVPVQTPVAFVGEEGDTIPEVKPPTAPKKAEAPKPPVSPKPAAREAPPPPQEAPAGPAVTAPQRPSGQVSRPPERKRISPRARKLAREKVIDPAGIQGTGPQGRVVERDVLAYLEANNYGNIRISAAAKQLAASENLDILKIEGSGTGGKLMVEDIKRAAKEKPKPMSNMRRIIARRLTESFQSIPHFYVAVEVDMTGLVEFRRKLKLQGAPYSVTDFIMEAAVLSLKEFPVVNSSTDGANIYWHGKVNLGLAVSLEEGLVVPVIRNAGDLSLLELHNRASELAAKARSGKLTPDEMKGGTFTVSNMGMVNVHDFNAIINPPEAAILAVSSTIKKPVVIDDSIAIRHIMNIRCSVDHRIVDGTKAAEFANSVKYKLEDIELWKRLT